MGMYTVAKRARQLLRLLRCVVETRAPPAAVRALWHLLFSSQVKDGRWAFTESPSMYDSNPGDVIPDVYGNLRSRWNVNDSP